MPNPQVSPGQSAVQGVNGVAADQSTILPLGSLTATIDNYAAAFVAYAKLREAELAIERLGKKE
jgi:hypothetical protein